MVVISVSFLACILFFRGGGHATTSEAAKARLLPDRSVIPDLQRGASVSSFGMTAIVVIGPGGDAMRTGEPI